MHDRIMHDIYRASGSHHRLLDTCTPLSTSSLTFNLACWSKLLLSLSRLPPSSRVSLKSDPRYRDVLSVIAALHCPSTVSSYTEPQQFNQTTAIAVSLARLNERPSDVLDAGCNDDDCKASAGHSARSILDSIDVNSDVIMKRGNTTNYANIAHSFAKLGYASSNSSDNSNNNFFQQLSDEKYVDRLMVHGKSMEIANVAWSYAKVDMRNDRLFAMIDERDDFIGSCSQQDISMIAWSAARLGAPVPNFVANLEKHTDWFVSTGSPQAVANTVWAAVVLDHDARNLVTSVGRYARPLLMKAKPQEVAMIAYSLAKAGYRCDSFFNELNKQSSRIIPNYNCQDISNTVWSYATLYSSSESRARTVEYKNLFSEVEKKGEFLIRCGTTQNIANTAWSFKKNSVDGSIILEEIDKRADDIIRRSTTQEISNISLAFAEMGDVPKNFFQFLSDDSERFVSTATCQELVNVAASVVTLDLLDLPLLSKVWERILATSPSEFAMEELRALAHCEIHSVVFEKDLTPVPTGLKAKMMEAAKLLDTDMEGAGVLDDYGVWMSHPNAADKISEMLTEIGFEHEREVAPARAQPDSRRMQRHNYGSTWGIDFANVEKKIAIEYDGTDHFLTVLSTNTLRENGRTKAKRRLLEGLGWKVVNIPFLHRILFLPKEEGLAYLRGRLEQFDEAVVLGETDRK
jgi:hypothetical protein